MSEKAYNYCPYCGIKLLKKYSSKANFCYHCGKKLRNVNKRIYPKVQCTICHKYISHEHLNTIKCSYCGSQYHESCVSSWLLKYNTCPMCQNVFIFPNNQVFEIKR
ncbi:MAG: RING finger domain-containing protein [Promethearchaeota archaeon]